MDENLEQKIKKCQLDSNMKKSCNGHYLCSIPCKETHFDMVCKYQGGFISVGVGKDQYVMYWGCHNAYQKPK
jgi:hypothetical protein